MVLNFKSWNKLFYFKVGMKAEKVDRVKNKNKKIKGKDSKYIEDSESVDKSVCNAVVNKIIENGSLTPLTMNPIFNLTIEEEFKIHELFVRREYLYDEMFQLFLQLSTFVNWENLLMTICRGSFDPSGKWNLFNRFELDFYSNLKGFKGIPIRLSLNMFDVFNSLEEGVKTEMFEFTMPLQILLLR